MKTRTAALPLLVLLAACASAAPKEGTGASSAHLEEATAPTTCECGSMDGQVSMDIVRPPPPGEGAGSIVGYGGFWPYEFDDEDSRQAALAECEAAKPSVPACGVSK